MEQNNPILKLFSMLSGILDSPPSNVASSVAENETTQNPPSSQPLTIKQRQKSTNKATSFMSAHERLSQKIKQDNK